jgi:hypothetical protein
VFQRTGDAALMAACWTVSLLTLLWYVKNATYERLEAYYDRTERQRERAGGPDRALTPPSLGRDVKMGFVTTIVWLGVIAGLVGLMYLLTLFG